MIDKLEAIKERYEEIGKSLADPALMSDMKNYTRISKEYKETLQKTPDSNYAKNRLGFCYLKTNQLDKQHDPPTA